MLAQAARTQAELEALFGKFLRAYPLLAPLGDKGAIKYVVWGVLAAPLLALLIPALLLPVRRKRNRSKGMACGGEGGGRWTGARCRTMARRLLRHPCCGCNAYCRQH